MIFKKAPTKPAGIAWPSPDGKYIYCRTNGHMRLKQLLVRYYARRVPEGHKLSYGLDIAKDLEEHGIRLRKDLADRVHFAGSCVDRELEALQIDGMALMPFQGMGVDFVEKNNHHALIADDMGLGKTIEAIGWAKRNPQIRPLVILVPQCVKEKWVAELRKYIPNEKIVPIYGRSKQKLEGDIFVVNFDIAYEQTKRGHLAKINAPGLVIDECQYVMTHNSKRTLAFKMLARRAKKALIALSGTPMLNRPMELYTVISALCPRLFGNRLSFGKRYCGGHIGRRGKWEFTGSSNEQELHAILTKSIMIRRLKEEVLDQFPNKPRINEVPFEINNRASYDLLEENMWEWLAKYKPGIEHLEAAKKAPSLVKAGLLRQVAAEGKAKEAYSWIEYMLTQTDKLAVYYWNRFAAEALTERFKDVCICPRFDGSSYECSVRFNKEKKLKLFIGSIASDAEGIDLTSSAHLALFQYPWSPKKRDQVRDRIWRIGQNQAELTLHYLVGKGTIDEDHLELLERKDRVIGKIMDGKKGSSDDLVSLLMARRSKELKRV